MSTDPRTTHRVVKWRHSHVRWDCGAWCRGTGDGADATIQRAPTKVRKVYDKLFYGDFFDVADLPGMFLLAAESNPSTLLSSFLITRENDRNLLLLHDCRFVHPTTKAKSFSPACVYCAGG